MPLPPHHPFHLLSEMYVSKCTPKDQYHIHLACFPRVVREGDINSHGWRAITVNTPSKAYLCRPTILHCVTLHYLTLNNIKAQGHLEVQLHILSQARSSSSPTYTVGDTNLNLIKKIRTRCITNTYIIHYTDCVMCQPLRT